MKNLDFTHDVLNGLDPALIEQASQTTKRRLSRPVRTALVAACLCLTLIGAAMAAEELMKGAAVQRFFSGSQFSEVMQKLDRGYQIIPGSKDDYSGYVIGWEGSGVRFENLSEEVKELLHSSRESRNVESIRFRSTAEMQEFMGVALYENAALDRLERRALAENKVEVGYNEEGEPLEFSNEVVGAVLNCTSYESGMNRLDLLSFYGLNNGALEVTVTAEVLSYDLEGSNGTAYVFADGTQFSEETYVTTNGDKITILRCDVPESYGNAPHTQYAAHFHVQGVRYQVCIICLENPEEGGELMKEILDAFEFNELS